MNIKDGVQDGCQNVECGFLMICNRFDNELAFKYTKQCIFLKHIYLA